jgi:hypothetical protein
MRAALHVILGKPTRTYLKIAGRSRSAINVTQRGRVAARCYEVAQAVRITLAFLNKFDNELRLSWSADLPDRKIQQAQRLLERFNQNLHVFRRKGVIVLKKEPNGHEGRPSTSECLP